MASTSLDAPFGMPGSVTVNPRYDLRRKVPDATVGYSFRTTSVKIETRDRTVTLAHAFGKDNRNQLVPTLATTTKRGGGSSLSYVRDLGSGGGSGKVTTSWTPNDSVAMLWTDGNWDATLRAPLEGFFGCKGGGVTLSMKQNIGVSLY